MPLQATSGAASYDAFGGGVAAVPNYIEDVFNIWLWTTTSSNDNETIPIPGDPTKDAMVWVKNRGANPIYGRSVIFDTVRKSGSFYPYLFTDKTEAQYVSSDIATNYTGNSIDTGTSGYVDADQAGVAFVGWTFREQPKFFDVVTYTGNDAGTREIAHNLGSAPGCMIVKSTSNSQDWFVWHRSSPGAGFTLNLNTTAAAYNSSNWGAGRNTPPTSTVFTVGDNANLAGYTYVAYLFAHNAGGFGLSGTDNVISCGSVVTDGLGGATVNLGYEPQWVLWKRADGTGNWHIIDTMRGMSQTGASFLYPNTSGAEGVANGTPSPFTATATGFQTTGYWINDSLHIYIAIRRGPMKVPTTGTSVFALNQYASSTNLNVPTGITVDLTLGVTATNGGGYRISDRLRGTGRPLFPYNTSAELSQANGFLYDVNNAVIDNYFFTQFGSSRNVTLASFRRAPGFFDEVCYTGTGSAQTLNHNLGVAPEMIIVKRRNGGGSESWVTQHSGLTGGIGQGANSDVIVYINSSNAQFDSDGTFNFSPTATTFALQNNANSQVNASGGTYAAYLFATCPGVSKVGSFTKSSSADINVDCGFTSGARFLLLKQTDSAENWYVYDTARGITTGNDPYLMLNSTAAESTTNNGIDPLSSGFILKGTQWNNGSYIFLAIA